MSGLERLLHNCHGKDETNSLSYVDDLLAHTVFGGAASHLGFFCSRYWGSPCLAQVFPAGDEHTWIGDSLCIARRTVGISGFARRGLTVLFG